jgi:prolyl oligopeptidase
MTQRPELMKVALPAVGVMDMLRYHTLRQVQVGHTIMEQHKIVKKCLNTLKAIPVHNVKAGTHYPATMVTTEITMIE